MLVLKKEFYRDAGDLLLTSIKGFGQDRAMKMSASLAYYSIFSIAPLLLIIIWLVGFLVGEYAEGERAIQEEIFSELTGLFGRDVATQIQDVITQISVEKKSGIGIGIGIGTLIVGSTTIFVQIQDSINTIWQVRARPRKSWVKMILNRVLSFSMVIGLGFLLIASLILNGIIVALGSYLLDYFPELSFALVEWINIGITFLVIAALFATIFSVLPDAKIRFTDALVGALVTAALFMLGRYLISLYMQFAAPASAYGAAGSVIILLLWVYYSAAILYFGAEFTKAYAEKFGHGIQPKSYAVRVILQEIEVGKPA